MAELNPTGVRNGLAAGDDNCANPPVAGDDNCANPPAGEGSAWAWLKGLAEVALLGWEKENPLFWPNDDGAFWPKGVLAGGCPNPPGPLPRLFPKEKVEGDGAGEASLPKPEPNPLPVCAPNPELAVFSGGAVGFAPNPPPLAFPDPKEKPEPVLAALKDVPFDVPVPPPRMGLESMLSSSSNFAVGVVGPLGNTSPGAPEPAFVVVDAPNENPVLAGAGAPKLNEPPGVWLPLGVASPGVPNENDGVVDGAAALSPPKLKPRLVVGVVWLVN